MNIWKYEKRVKRLADILEKLGVAGVALGIFQQNWSGLILGSLFLAASLALTRED